MIPRNRPSFVFEAAVPFPWSEAYARPILSRGGDMVLVAGGWDQHFFADERSVLAAADAATGAPRFVHRAPALGSGPSECQVALPVVAPGGRIGVAVYQWDVSLVVQWLDERGALLREDDCAAGRERDLHVLGGDAGIKLRLRPLAILGDAYMVSWVYRSRFCHLQCRALDDGRLRWEAEAALVAPAEAAAIVETDPPRAERRPEGAAIIAHAPADGRRLWALPPIAPRKVRARSPAGVCGDSLLLIDRGEWADALDARDQGILDLAVATDSEDFEELERHWDADHPLPGETIVAVDVASGRERWQRRVAGAVRSIVSGPDTAWAVCAPLPHAADRRAILQRFLADGATGFGGALELDDPVVVAGDGEMVLLATARELVAVAAGDPTRPFWRVDVPVDVSAGGAANDSSLTGAAVTIADDGRIYFRRDGHLWCLRG